MMGIPQMIRNCHSISSVKQEMASCAVRCANCHRVKTFSRGNFWKTKWARSFNGKTSVSKTEVPRSSRGGPASRQASH